MLDCSVSVLVPTYDGAKYLRECLDSVLAQTYQKWDGMLLDRLVPLHEYAFNETYSALRKVAFDRSPPVDFAALLAREAREARRIAVAVGINRNDWTFLEEWERLLQTYARIIDLLYVASGPRLTALGRLTTEGLFRHCELPMGR